MKKRNLKDVLFGITIGGLIFGGIGVAAITLTASEIKYTPSNELSTATNVKDAMDELYTMSEELKKGELTLVGTTTSFNIADIVGAENVGKYTADDFVCIPNLDAKLSGQVKSNITGVFIDAMKMSMEHVNDYVLEYDSSTGDVQVENMQVKVTTTHTYQGGSTGSMNGTFTIPPKVYLSM